MVKWAGPSRVTGWFLLHDFGVGEGKENREETKWGGSNGPPLLFFQRERSLVEKIMTGIL